MSSNSLAKARDGPPVLHKSIHGPATHATSAQALSDDELSRATEELQSVNKDLVKCNDGLRQEIEQHRIMSRDLRNVLHNAEVATIFLDAQLNIRFFTPVPHQRFGVTASDIGRGLADLHWIPDDIHMLSDATAVLASGVSMEREIGAGGGLWYLRRVLRNSSPGMDTDGLIVTFCDVTERRRTTDALAAAKRESDLADAAKTLVLASASHDLRQPLQTLALLHGLLEKMVHGTKQQELVTRIDEALQVMSGILDTLLDISQIDADVVHADKADFAINDLLEQMKDEFTYQAIGKKISLRSVSSSVIVHSDRLRLEQMVRSLCSNALKNTRNGKILLGCRRRRGMLNIEIWDTGMGLAREEVGAIFNEYHKLTGTGRERSRGLGPGLSIVNRLGELLGHDLNVKSEPGRGSVFSIEVPIARDPPGWTAPSEIQASEVPTAFHRTGSILVIEDDPDVLTLLEMLVRDDGHFIATASNGADALALIEDRSFWPDLVLVSNTLPNGVDGVTIAAQVRARLGREIPVLILTGDITTEALRDIAGGNCIPMRKPASLRQLTQAVQRELSLVAHAEPLTLSSRTGADAVARPIIFVVDDDQQVLEAVRLIFEAEGHDVRAFATAEDFLEDAGAKEEGCLLVDIHLPGMSGLDLLAALRPGGHTLPAIMITGSSNVSMAVAAMKYGAIDFIEKPISRIDLLASVGRAIALSDGASAKRSMLDSAARHIASLTKRQKQIMALVLAGQPSKNIAADLGISQRTVENHRAAIMKRTGSKSIPALARLALFVDDPG